MNAVTPDGVKHRCVAFRVSGEMRSPVRVVPDIVLLGEHPVGAISESIVSIRFPTEAWLLNRIETEHTDTRVLPTEPLDGHPAYRILQPITNPSDGTCQVRFVCTKPNGQLETVTTTLRWYGEPSRKGQLP